MPSMHTRLLRNSVGDHAAALGAMAGHVGVDLDEQARRKMSPGESRKYDDGHKWGEALGVARAEVEKMRKERDAAHADAESYKLTVEEEARRLLRAKRATVRIGLMLRRPGGALEPDCYGSGCFVSRDGHILTAAHLFDQKQLFGHADEDVLIAIGAFEGDKETSRWRWWAELQTPPELLSERLGEERLDLAVLRVRGELELEPPMYEADQVYTVKAERSEQPSVSTDEMQPLLEEPGICTGADVTVLSWPLWLFLDKTIHVSQSHVLSQENSTITTRALIHKGSSGGPLLNEQYELVGVVLNNPGSDIRMSSEARGGGVKTCARDLSRVGIKTATEEVRKSETMRFWHKPFICSAE